MKNKLDFGIRPKCSNHDCDNDRQFMGNYRKDDSPIYRAICGSCHSKKTAAKRGFKYLAQVVAANAGLTLTEYTNQFHPYRKYRKDYCENDDGRLGFVCTTNIIWDGMLDVDHKNGKPDDNRPQNLQTLCKCCHAYKTNLHEDYASPGRKKLKKVEYVGQI
jgi:cytochrome c553